MGREGRAWRGQAVQRGLKGMARHTHVRHRDVAGICPPLHAAGRRRHCTPPPPPLPPPLQVSAGAMLPITAVQFGMNRFLEQTYRRVMKTEQLSMGGTVALAMGAGASSAFLGCPAE